MDGKGVGEPHDGTHDDNQDHPNAEIAHAFGLPWFAYLRNERDRSKKGAKIASEFDPVHLNYELKKQI